MPLTHPLRKAMILIAVSKYDGSYKNLPGTLTSAKRLATWARQPGEGKNYKTLEINDEQGDPVTVERLKREISSFLRDNIIDRLAVYFAGHGIVRTSADQYWLLTRAESDVREGVNVTAFKRNLMRQGIGAHHPELRCGQLCLIVDACRNTSEAALDFVGDPIISAGGIQRSLQVDFFFATMFGKHAYQPKGVNGQPPYCLFSSILSDALEGNVQEVIETQHHPFRPAIVNNLLADYLEAEVPNRAALFNERMEPDIATNVRMAHNYYDLLALPQNTVPRGNLGLPVEISENEPSEVVEAIQMGADEDQERLATQSAYFQDLLEAAIASFNAIKRHMRLGREIHPSILVETRKQIAIPHAGISYLRRLHDTWVYAPPWWREHYNPVFVELDGFWLLAPVLRNTTAFLSRFAPRDLLLQVSPDSWEEFPEFEWDTSLSNIASLTHRPFARVSDAMKFADRVRVRKSENPNFGNIAGYLYDFIGDHENICRTAHFLVSPDGPPIDLALLASESVRWGFREGNWRVFADLPAVPQAEDASSERPRYARTAFEAARNVPVQGIFPIFRQGWIRLADDEMLRVPPILRKIANSLAGGSAVVIPDAEMRDLANFFNYRIVSREMLEEQHDDVSYLEDEAAAAGDDAEVATPEDEEDEST